MHIKCWFLQQEIGSQLKDPGTSQVFISFGSSTQPELILLIC